MDVLCMLNCTTCIDVLDVNKQYFELNKIYRNVNKRQYLVTDVSNFEFYNLTFDSTENWRLFFIIFTLQVKAPQNTSDIFNCCIFQGWLYSSLFLLLLYNIIYYKPFPYGLNISWNKIIDFIFTWKITIKCICTAKYQWRKSRLFFVGIEVWYSNWLSNVLSGFSYYTDSS